MPAIPPRADPASSSPDPCAGLKTAVIVGYIALGIIILFAYPCINGPLRTCLNGTSTPKNAPSSSTAPGTSSLYQPTPYTRPPTAHPRGPDSLPRVSNTLPRSPTPHPRAKTAPSRAQRRMERENTYSRSGDLSDGFELVGVDTQQNTRQFRDRYGNEYVTEPGKMFGEGTLSRNLTGTAPVRADLGPS